MFLSLPPALCFPVNVWGLTWGLGMCIKLNVTRVPFWMVFYSLHVMGN